MKTPTKAQTQALEFIQACKESGFSWEVRSESIVTITKRFTPGDKDGFCDADISAFGILSRAPLKGGSVWGTDGGSVGGYVGLNKGEYRLNKSGNGINFIKALKKM